MTDFPVVDAEDADRPTPIKAKQCGTCRFAEFARTPDGQVDFGMRVCRWGPPTAVLINMAKGIQVATMFPAMKVGDWCHRHEGLDG